MSAILNPNYFSRSAEAARHTSCALCSSYIVKSEAYAHPKDSSKLVCALCKKPS